MMERKMTPTDMDTVARLPQHRLQGLYVCIGLKETVTSEQKEMDLLEKYC